MSYPVIASKTDNNNWFIEKCSVTLTLVQMSPADPKFGLSYSADWSGVKKGNTAGGPYPVAGNGTTVVNQDPKVTLIVSDYTDTGSTISMHVEVTVDAGGVIGTKTVFDDTLSGSYPAAGLTDMVASMQADMAAQPAVN